MLKIDGCTATRCRENTVEAVKIFINSAKLSREGCHKSFRLFSIMLFLISTSIDRAECPWVAQKILLFSTSAFMQDHLREASSGGPESCDGKRGSAPEHTKIANRNRNDLPSRGPNRRESPLSEREQFSLRNRRIKSQSLALEIRTFKSQHSRFKRCRKLQRFPACGRNSQSQSPKSRDFMHSDLDLAG